MVRFKNESNFKLMNHLLFSNGFYSRLFEVAEVIAVFNKADYSYCSNFRPTTLLSTFGKIR